MSNENKSAAYNLGKILGAIATTIAVNKTVDKMNRDAEDSMKRTLDKATDSLNRINSIYRSDN